MHSRSVEHRMPFGVTPGAVRVGCTFRAADILHVGGRYAKYPGSAPHPNMIDRTPLHNWVGETAAAPRGLVPNPDNQRMVKLR
jgi:hypothetical protein